MIFGDALIQLQQMRASAVVGYTAGVFDLFHYGHQKYLQACCSLCDCLVVGVDVDSVVRAKKGTMRPIQPTEVRLARVRKTHLVMIAFPKDRSAKEILPLFRPDLYFVPSNRVLTHTRMSLVTTLGINLVRLPYTEGISTSFLVDDGSDDRAYKSTAPSNPAYMDSPETQED